MHLNPIVIDALFAVLDVKPADKSGTREARLIGGEVSFDSL
jgi:hypothetical protein